MSTENEFSYGMILKIRAWDEDQKKMVRPRLVENESGEVIDERGFFLTYFTGIADVYGNEIYEGDIIVIPNQYLWFDDGQPNYRGVVEWVFSQWQVIAHCVNSSKRGVSDGMNYGLNDDGVDDRERSRWLVIGNVFQNPELLAPEL